MWAWDLAGVRWRSVLRAHGNAIIEEMTGPLNAPKSSNVKALFKDVMGIPDVTDSWRWPRMTASAAQE